jgi:hypothetical protein
MWNTEQLRVFISGIEGLRTILFPDGTPPFAFPFLLTCPPTAPVVPDHTGRLLQQVASARALHDSLHTDLVRSLRTLFSNVREHTRRFSEEAFQQHFRSTIPDASARSQMNAVIHAFNHYNNPATQRHPLPAYQLSADEAPPAGPSKLPPKKPVLKKEEPELVSKEEGETDADGEGEDAPDGESTKLSPSAGEKRKRGGAK